MSIDKGKDGFLCSILALSLTLVLKPRAGTAPNNKTWSEFWTRDLLALQLQCVHTGDRLQSHIVFWWSLLEISPVVLCWSFKPPMCIVSLWHHMPHLTYLMLPTFIVVVPSLSVSLPLCLPLSLSLPRLVFFLRKICLWSYTCDKVSAECFPFTTTVHCYAWASWRLSLTRGEITPMEVT